MKIYRLHMTVDNGVSIGYEFFTAKSAAEKRRRDHLKENDEDPTANSVDVLEFTPTKTGIVDLLNREAGHPDNG